MVLGTTRPHLYPEGVLVSDRWNPHVRDACPTCRGWTFLPGSKDPDTEYDCTDCNGTGVRPKENRDVR